MLSIELEHCDPEQIRLPAPLEICRTLQKRLGPERESEGRRPRFGACHGRALESDVSLSPKNRGNSIEESLTPPTILLETRAEALRNTLSLAGLLAFTACAVERHRPISIEAAG
jgi:hypothetical protein